MGLLWLSIKPWYAASILAGSKRVELRRSRPPVGPGDVVVLYASAPQRALVGVARVVSLECAAPTALWRRVRGEAGIPKPAFDAYFAHADRAHAIWLDQPSAWREPIALAELRGLVPGWHVPISFRRLRHDRMADVLLAGVVREKLPKGKIAKGQMRSR